MSFTISNWTCLSPSLNQGQQTVTPFGSNQTTLNAPNIFIYGSPTDSVAQIITSGYFNPVATGLSVEDWILGNGSDGTFLIYVTSISNGVVTVDFVDQGGGGGIYLLKSANLLDVANPDEALTNLGTGSGEVIFIDDSDFSLDFYQIPIPYPKIVIATVTIPDQQIRLPVANVPGESPSIGQGVIIKSVNSSETINIALAISGDIISSVTGNEASQFFLQDNSTPLGSWYEEPYVYQVNATSGDVNLDSSDIEVDPDFTPTNYIPVADGWSADSITGNLVGIDNALGDIIPSEESFQDAYDTGDDAIVTMSDSRPIIFQTSSNGPATNAISTQGTGSSSSPVYRVIGYRFTPAVDMLVTALQYDDAMMVSTTFGHDTGIYNFTTFELLGKVTIYKTDPLDSSMVYRTKDLNSPILLQGGQEYVFATVQNINEFVYTVKTVVPNASVSLLELAQLPQSSTGVSLQFPQTFTPATPDQAYLGSFVFNTFTVSDNVNINDGTTSDNILFQVSSTGRASVPAPVMTTAEMNAIPTPSAGMQVFNSNSSPIAPYFYDGSAWINFLNASTSSNITVTNTTTNASFFVPIITASATAVYPLYVGASLTFNPSTSTLTTTNFAGTALNATNTGITDDTTTNSTMYPTWVTATTGNLPQKVSSTKLTFNPSTGRITTTSINLTGLTANQAVATDASKNFVSLQYDSALVASTLVARDSSGNFSANIITASLNGNASTSTTATTATTATNATNVLATNTTSVATYYPLYVSSSTTNNQGAKMTSAFQFQYQSSTQVYLHVDASAFGNASITLKRNSNTNYAQLHFYTGSSSNQITLGLRGNTNEHFYIFDELNGVNILDITPLSTPIITWNGWQKINDSTAPGSNPSGGGYLYSESGAGKWRGSGGTVTTFGPAEPHCPVCDSDFGLEWQNEKYGGTLRVCMKCFSEDMGNKPYIRWNEK